MTPYKTGVGMVRLFDLTIYSNSKIKGSYDNDDDRHNTRNNDNNNNDVLGRQPQAAKRVDHLPHKVAAAAVEEGRVPDDHVPHVDKLRQRVALLVHDLLGPLDSLHELLRPPSI